MKIGTLASPLAKTCHLCAPLHGDLRPEDSSVLSSAVTRLPSSQEQVRMMIGRSLAEATERRAAPYLVAYLARSATRLVVVVVSASEQELAGQR
jgi:K+-sensing histidine kinase KdpD